MTSAEGVGLAHTLAFYRHRTAELARFLRKLVQEGRITEAEWEAALSVPPESEPWDAELVDALELAVEAMAASSRDDAR